MQSVAVTVGNAENASINFRRREMIFQRTTSYTKSLWHQSYQSRTKDVRRNHTRFHHYMCGSYRKEDEWNPTVGERRGDILLRHNCSINPEERRRLQKIYRKVIDRRNGGSPNGKGGRETGRRTSLI